MTGKGRIVNEHLAIDDRAEAPPHDELAQRAMESAEAALGRIKWEPPQGEYYERAMDALLLLREALDRDPRGGSVQSRMHWLHIKDGDRMVWHLVGELRAMHRDVDGLIAHLSNQAGTEPPTSERLQALRLMVDRASAERDQLAAHIVLLTAERDELRTLLNRVGTDPTRLEALRMALIQAREEIMREDCDAANGIILAALMADDPRA